MQKYYFDVYDDERKSEDKVGIVIAYNDIAGEAEDILRFITCERIPYDTPPKLVVEVRNEVGRVVYHTPAELKRWTA